MRLLPKLFLLLGLASSFIACTPRSVLRLEADETASVRWNSGRQIVQLQNDSFDVDVYFDTYNKHDLIFDVELTNFGKNAALVSPETIYLKCSPSGSTRTAADPENVLLKQEIDASRREANAKNIAIAVGAVAAASIVTAAIVNDGNNNNGNNNNDNNVNSNNVFISTYVAPPMPAPVLPPAVDFWANYALRKTTLEENYKVGGKVVLPRMDACPVLELYLPFGEGEPMVARFNQRIFQP